MIPKKRPTSAVRLDVSETSSQHLSSKDPTPKFNDSMYLPPRPSEKVDVLTYGECSSKLKLFLTDGSDLRITERELSVLDIEQTIDGANEILKSLKGKVATYDRFILLYIIFGLIGFGVVGFIFGYFIHFSISIVIGLLYFAILGGSVYFFKK